MSIGDFVVCPNCNGKGGYHNYPCSGFVPPAFYAPHPPGERTGAVPAKFVTEEDVRRIVLDTLDRVLDWADIRDIERSSEWRRRIGSVRKELKDAKP